MESKISLFCVPTPIGNLNDMPPRALETLKAVDFIAAEDTRNSGILLKLFDIKKPMVSYFEHNKAEHGEIILKRLEEGETCALITDAGMPAISDPGEDLVRLCLEKGLTVSALPGPCAAVTALAMSGLPTGRFCFEGFLPAQKGEREKRLLALEEEERTMIFYEAPHRLSQTLADLAAHFGEERRISLAREISKIHEETLLTELGNAIAYFEETPPRGEFVLTVEGCPEKEPVSLSEEELKEMFDSFVDSGMSKSQAAKEVATKTGLKKRDIYNRFN